MSKEEMDYPIMFEVKVRGTIYASSKKEAMRKIGDELDIQEYGRREIMELIYLNGDPIEDPVEETSPEAVKDVHVEDLNTIQEDLGQIIKSIPNYPRRFDIQSLGDEVEGLDSSLVKLRSDIQDRMEEISDGQED